MVTFLGIYQTGMLGVTWAEFLTHKNSGSGTPVCHTATSSKSHPLFEPMFPHVKQEDSEPGDR